MLNGAFSNFEKLFVKPNWLDERQNRLSFTSSQNGVLRLGFCVSAAGR
jgi:hypothetical protein